MNILKALTLQLLLHEYVCVCVSRAGVCLCVK